MLAALILTSVMVLAVCVRSAHAHTAGTRVAGTAASSQLPVQSEIRNRTRAQLRLLPSADRHGSCHTTEYIRGIGKACRAGRDLFSIKAGSSFVTSHGFDAPPPSAFASYLSGSSAAMSSASASDISCVDPATTKHTVLVYAYPSDASSRYATIAPLLREESYKLSAFLGAESQAVDPTKTQRLQLECDSNDIPVVLNLHLSHTGASDSFSSIVSDMSSLGYGGDFSLAAKDRYLVFYDGSIGAGVAGMGHLYQSDAASSTSANNSGGLVAIEFNWGGVPHFATLLHEAGHNMGAVQASAPNTSGTLTGGGSAGHCSDGLDIMCYDDGGSNGYDSSVCAITVFDCNRNDFFNPSPAAGSYLDTHWNIAASYNQYLQHAAAIDSAPPSAPTSVTATGVSDTSVSISWDASTDDIGVTEYRIWQIDGASSTQIGTVSSRLTFAIDQLTPSTSYTFGVSAADAAGNQSAITTVDATTTATPDVEPPTAPSSAVVAAVRVTSATLTWGEGTDNVGVSSYHIYQTSPVAKGVGWTAEVNFRVRGLKPNTNYSFGIASVDAAGHESEQTPISFRTAPDTTAPARPSAPHVAARARHWIKLSWHATTDNAAVGSYRVYRLTSSGWRLVGTTSASVHVLTVRNLNPGYPYFFRIRARDTSGNVSGWSGLTATRTRF